MQLPSKKGDKVAVWTDLENGGAPARIVMMCKGNLKWSMHTEEAQRLDASEIKLNEDRSAYWTGAGWMPCEEAEDGNLYEWTEGGSFKLTLDTSNFREGLDRAFMDVPRVAIDGGETIISLSAWCITGPQQIKRPVIDMREPSIVSQTKGKKQLVVSVEGCGQDGMPFVSVRTNKALNPGEWMVALQALAQALDNTRADFLA